MSRGHGLVLVVALRRSRGAVRLKTIDGLLLGLHQFTAGTAVAAEAVHALRALKVEAFAELVALEHLDDPVHSDAGETIPDEALCGRGSVSPEIQIIGSKSGYDNNETRRMCLRCC